MIFTVDGAGFMDIGLRRMRCALGQGGIVEARLKREGDGATPAGLWPLRQLRFRPDRETAPKTGLPARALDRSDGWCDDPGDRSYNRPVRMPYPASAEGLWRADHLYDLLVVLGHNDDPVIAGAGSAIFLHLADRGYAPTLGCIALHRRDMIDFLAVAAAGDALAVSL